MIVTNNHNLPDVLVNIVKNDLRPYTNDRYSVTELLKPIKYILLERRYYDKLTTDVSNRINMLFGTAFHNMMETGAKDEEVRLEYTLDCGVTISGRIDKFADFTITEYKTTTAFKWNLGDFEDWKKQGILYAWLLRKQGQLADKLKVTGFIKDWSKSRSEREAGYPEFQVMTWEYAITSEDIAWAEAYVRDRAEKLTALKDAPHEKMPQYTDEELWKKPDQWALFRGTNKRATKVYDYPITPGVNERVEHRKGAYTRVDYDEILQQLLRITGEIKNYI